ncbi:MAG: oligopeptide/dipeptide ABC transporter ATP-binding protein [Planctomyces sp.]
MDLKDRLGLTLVFISHDLKVIEHFCDRVLVMYLGGVVEERPCDELLTAASHPYTRALLGANPIDDPSERATRPLTVLQGDVPSPYNLPIGCAFAGRCPKVMDRCKVERPLLEAKRDGRRVACFAVE